MSIIWLCQIYLTSSQPHVMGDNITYLSVLWVLLYQILSKL